MCRMLGIIGTPPLPAPEAMEAFQALSQNGRVKCTMTPGHLDGWGISGFSNGRAVYFDRRAEPAANERPLLLQAAERAQRSQSSVLIAHLRKASTGARDVSNTHPFHYR